MGSLCPFPPCAAGGGGPGGLGGASAPGTARGARHRAARGALVAGSGSPGAALGLSRGAAPRGAGAASRLEPGACRLLLFFSAGIK